MPNEKIKAKELLSDIRAGMDSLALRKKYQISSESLNKFIKQLINAGYLNQPELKKVPRTFICPACSKSSSKEFSECPYCGVIVSKYLKKKVEEEKKKTTTSPQLESAPKSLLITCPTCQKEISKNAVSCPHCGEPAISSDSQTKELSVRSGEFVCRNCGYIGKPKSKDKGNILTEIILWLFFLLPGLIYSLYRLSSRKKVCPKCEAPNMIPGDSPVLNNRLEKQEMSNNPAPKNDISFSHLLSWIFGVLFIFFGLIILSSIPIIGLIYLVMGCFLVPPIINKIEKEFNFKISSKFRIIFLIVCFMSPGLIVPFLNNDSRKVEKSEDIKKISQPEISNKSTKKHIVPKSDNYTTIKKPSNVNAEADFEASAKRLYIELLSFKDNSDFHKYGFSKSPYKNWSEACQKLSNNKNSNLILVKEKGFLVGDICQLAEEYIFSKGKETDYSKYIRPQLDSGFGIK